MWHSKWNLVFTFVLLFVATNCIDALSPEEEDEESWLLNFKRVEQILGAPPKFSASDIVGDKAEWRVSEKNKAEIMVANGDTYNAISKYQTIFATCCGTLRQIKVG